MAPLKLKLEAWLKYRVPKKYTGRHVRHDLDRIKQMFCESEVEHKNRYAKSEAWP